MSAAAPHADLFAKQPLRFEENRGQAEAGVRYLAKGPNYLLTLTSSGNALTLASSQSNGKAIIQTRLLGTKSSARLEALEPLPTRTNYFIGRAAQDWHVGVQNYAKIQARDLYPGIDLVFYGNPGALEYDFVVKPGADPSAIKLQVTGAQKVLIDSNGDLLLQTAAGDARWKRPVLYQRNADGKRQMVDGHLAILNNNRIHFSVGRYDRSRDLIIDPVFSYSTYFGSSGNEAGRTIAADSAGNVYIAGITSSFGLQVTPKVLQTVFGGVSVDDFTGDGFIAKFNSAGGLVWATYLGGDADDAVTGIAVDPAGNVYLAGMTNSRNFPITAGALQPNYGGFGGNFCTVRLGDAFVAKLNPSGSELIYSTYLGGTQDDGASAIAIDASGNAYVAGVTLSPNFPTTAGVVQKVFKGGGGEPGKPACDGFPYIDFGDAFVAKLNPTGTQLLFSTYLGGSADDLATAIAVDSSNNVYVAGATISKDFPNTPGSFQNTFKGVDPQNEFYNYGDGFVTKLNSTATQLVYSTYLGGRGDDEIFSMTLDAQGNVYVAGATSSPDFPLTAQAIQNRYGGYTVLPFNTEQLYGDAFVSKLNATGTALLYSTFLGGSNNELGNAVGVAPSGLIYVAGSTDSRNFPVTPDAVQGQFAGDGGQQTYLEFGDGFLTIIDVNSNKPVYSTYFGGSMDDQFEALTFDSSENLWILGNTMSADFPITVSTAAQKTYGGFLTSGGVKGDATLVKFSGLPVGTNPLITSVVNGASFQSSIVSNSWATIFGNNLSSQTTSWDNAIVDGQLPTTLAGVTVTIGGQNAYLSYVTAGQVNLLTPNIGAGTLPVVLTNSVGTTTSFNVASSADGPAFFPWPDNQVVATHEDFSPAAKNGSLGAPTVPAKPGDVIILWGTGFGPTSPAAPVGVVTPSTQTYSTAVLPTVTVDNLNATVYGAALAPGFAGLFQVAIQVPTSLANGDWPIQATIAGVQSPSGTILTVQK